MHDVAKVPVPSYMPDVRAVREDWAQYYDQLTVMDRIAGQRLAELEAACLAGDTIVMYYGDHGPGLARSKRTTFNSGLQVPLVVYIPPKFRDLGPPEAARPGSESRRLVSFVDLAPTLLSLAGVKPPAWMQGRAFLGPFATPDPEFLFGFRGRMDERYDLVRSVRDQRYVYVRNYMPHRPDGQYYSYGMQTPSTAAWKRLFDRGALPAVQQAYWLPRPTEQLFDLETDPDETVDLAAAPAHRTALDRLRRALDAHEREIRDVGFMPEYELHRDERTITVYERGHDPARYDFERVYDIARKATDRAVGLDVVLPALADRDALVRYWAATGVLIRGAAAVETAGQSLTALLDDVQPGPRIVAAEAVARFGGAADRTRAIDVLALDADARQRYQYVAGFALYSLSQVPDLSNPVKAAVATLPTTPTEFPEYLTSREPFLDRLIEAIQQGAR